MEERRGMESFARELFGFFPLEWAVFLTAALPIIELRGAIPMGISLGMAPLEAALISLAGSTMPVPFILLAVVPVFNSLKRTPFLKARIDRLTERTLLKNGGRLERYGAWGLLLFVAVPLPGTGVWTGSLLAALFGMRFRFAFPAVFMGNVVAGILVMALSHGLFSLIRG